jgi:hypothetical protein
MAVLENPGAEIDDEIEPAWPLYFDRDDDGLRAKVKDKRVIQLTLIRGEVQKTKAQAEKAAKEAGEKEEVTTRNNPASESIGKYSYVREIDE